MGRLIDYFRQEKMLGLALLLAVLSSLAVHPDREYLGYVDLKVLALLFCLMLLVKGFQSIGLFDWLIEKVFGGVSSSRMLCLWLILLCFFTGMIITNDVALITFVPFAMLALRLCGQEKLMIRVVVMQTIAANLGSMCTPIGNPQNLYLFSASGMSLGMFFKTMLPLSVISLVLILAVIMTFPNEKIAIAMKEHHDNMKKGELIVYSVLFAVNLLVVFRVISWIPALLLTVAGVCLLKKQKLLLRVDYTLLLTFVGFFVFVGNLGRVPWLSQWLEQMLQGREMLLAAVFSQALSNVPTAILLSGFTDRYAGLMIGTNIGGLGTLIASMASLISYKLYAAQKDADRSRYMKVFTGYNVAGLILLLLFGTFWY